MSMKIFSDTIRNRTRDLPVCSAVPQPLHHQQQRAPREGEGNVQLRGGRGTTRTERREKYVKETGKGSHPVFIAS
jgi:hypothetical protein